MPVRDRSRKYGPARRLQAWAVLLCLTAFAPAAAAETQTAPQTDAADGALTAPQKAAVDQAIHDYLMNHPDVLLDALTAAQAKSDAEEAEQTRRVIAEKRTELLSDPDDLVQGNPNGDVTIVEFFDYRCPYCKEVQPELDALLKEDPKLRIVYKEFPILGEASVYASHLALAARPQGKYAEFHRAMMATKGDIEDDTVQRVAASVGIDLDKAKAGMASDKIERIISANYDLAEALNIQGTPALIIGDTLIPGVTDLDALRKDVASLRKTD